MEYLYQKVQDANFDDNTPHRKAFRNHLKKVAKALHDIEWVDSRDYGPGRENEAILACVAPADVVGAAQADVIKSLEALLAALCLI